MHFEANGTLTDRDAKQHIAHTFAVEEGATMLRLRFAYAPARGPAGLNALHLSLFDPRGFRGARHRQGEPLDGGRHHMVVLGAAEATPGYEPGPIPAGEWTVVIDTHMIVPGEPVEYSIAIDTSHEPATVAPTPPLEARPAQRAGPGWYRGDLHAHSVHSDATWQVADLLAAADAFGLDFVTLSDHNTVSGLAEFDRLARPGLLTVGASELTTYRGHALALGVRRWVDWRVRPGEHSMLQIATEVYDAGGLFVIAHPMSPGDPICTGCDWRYADMLPGTARLVEVWNGGRWESGSNNENALALWYTWLNEGHRLVATAGTDAHGPAPAGVRPGFDVVYAEELSEAALLRAIGQGHLYLSDGPRIALEGEGADGAGAMMGDTLPAGDTRISARWEGCDPTDAMRLIVDGRPLAEQVTGERGEQQWHLRAGQARWCVLEVRAAAGHLRAVSNPIFIGAPDANTSERG